MFETAELGRSMPKALYREQEPLLRQELLQLQEELRAIDHSQVILVFAGVDGAGKGQTVNLLNEWMDPRWLITRAFDEPADVERERPPFWRYWLALPPRGRIGMFLSSWYSEPVLQRVHGDLTDSEFDTALDRVVTFETELADDGAVILKFWMHLSREAQKARFESLEADPLTRVRITERDWENWERYDDFITAAERVIMRTHTGKAPWTIVEGADECYRSIAVGTLIRDTLRKRIDEIKLEEKVRAEIAIRLREEQNETAQSSRKKPKKKKGKSRKRAKPDGGETGSEATGADSASPCAPTPAVVTVLSHLDMTKKLAKSEYTRTLRELQARLHTQHHRAKELGISTLLVFEGPDAAGKGGAIRRINAALDARNYQVHGVAAPTDEEQAQHYLWRFWRHLERAGRFTIFDRSWYGRVLVERIEGYARDEEWRRAYNEINDFEAQLTEHGIVLLKYWVHCVTGH